MPGADSNCGLRLLILWYAGWSCGRGLLQQHHLDAAGIGRCHQPRDVASRREGPAPQVAALPDRFMPANREVSNDEPGHLPAFHIVDHQGTWVAAGILKAMSVAGLRGWGNSAAGSVCWACVQAAHEWVIDGRAAARRPLLALAGKVSWAGWSRTTNRPVNSRMHCQLCYGPLERTRQVTFVLLCGQMPCRKLPIVTVESR